MSDEESAENQPSEAKRFWRRFRIFVLNPLLVLLAFCGVTIGWMSSRNNSAQIQVNQRRAQILSQGLPVDNATLAQYHDGLSTTQELDAWLQLITDLQSDEFKLATKDFYPWKAESSAPNPDEVWPEHLEVMKFLDEQNKLLRTAQNLARADVKRRMPVTMDGINTDLKWANSVRQVARLFQLQSAEAIYRKDSAETCDAILDLLGCARSVEGQPMIVSQLIAIAIESIAIEELQRAIELNILNAEDAQRLLARLQARTPWHTLWRVGINSERGALLPAFEHPRAYLGNERNPFINMPWRARDQLEFLTITETMLSLPINNLDDFRNECRKQNSEIENKLRHPSLTASFDNAITGYLLPAYGAYGEAIVQREMRFRLAELAIGVRLYQHKTGKLPVALDDLKEVGVDPTKLKPPGGKPFGFRKLEASVALWGFQSRNTESTPDDPPSLSEGNHQWDRMWSWQLDQ